MVAVTGTTPAGASDDRVRQRGAKAPESRPGTDRLRMIRPLVSLLLPRPALTCPPGPPHPTPRSPGVPS